MKEKVSEKTEVAVLEEKELALILYNDDFNTFDHVIHCLVTVCGHEPQAAEQLAGMLGMQGGYTGTLIGVGIAIISKLIPFSNHIINAISIFMIYIVMNMINGSSKNYCKKGSSIGIILALIVLNIFLGFAKK